MTDRAQDYPKNNVGRELIPLKLVNRTGRTNLYFYIVGTTDPRNSDRHWYYVSDFNGNVTQCTPTNGETSYSLPLTETETVIQLPRLSAIRVYFSFDKKLNLVVGDNGVPGSPAGWAKDSNFQTLFDWVEATWEVNETDMTLGGNTTQVDMFGLPFSLSLTGFDADKQPATVTGGFSHGGLRHQIFKALREAPGPWNKLIISDAATGEAYRAISPYHGMELEQLFPRDQLDDYIDQVWEKYRNEKLTAAAEDVSFTGQVDNDELVFTGGDGETIIFTKPDSFTVYTSGPLPTTPGAKAGILQAALQASFIRSTLLLSSVVPDCDSSHYYRGEPVNLYAKTFHEYGTDGGAYAFGFDDVCSHSSFVIVHNPISAKITLLEF